MLAQPPTQPAPGSTRAVAGGVARGLRSVSGVISVAGAALIWLALLGPVITLFVHLSPGAIASALRAPGALTPLVVSLESGGVTLAVLVGLGTPLAWLMARGRLPWPRLWEAGVLAALLLPPLVVGLLLVFMVGPVTPIGQALATIHLSATNTFLALVIAQVYESAPYYVLGAQAAFGGVDPRLEEQAGLLGDRWERADIEFKRRHSILRKPSRSGELSRRHTGNDCQRHKLRLSRPCEQLRAGRQHFRFHSGRGPGCEGCGRGVFHYLGQRCPDVVYSAALRDR